MTRRKKGHSNDTDELWSRKFDDDEGYTNGNYSRIERKKADKAISPVLKSLWIFLALFIILPTGVYLWYSYNEQNNVEPPETEKVVVKESESNESQKEPESESSEETEASESSQESEEESSETESETEAAVSQEESVESQESSVSQEPESTVSEESQPVESEESETTNTYTVQAGDNLYRIALNHGMTTEELKSMNGISSDSVSAGTVLVVK